MGRQRLARLRPGRLFCAFTGFFQDLVVWQPLRRRGLGLAQMMIVTIGLALALQYVYQYFVGADTVKIVLSRPARRTLWARSSSTPST